MEEFLIDRLVAAATGESIRVIRARGFQHANPAEPEFDPEPLSRLTVALLYKRQRKRAPEYDQGDAL